MRLALQEKYGNWLVINEVDPLRKGKNVTRRVHVRCLLCGEEAVRNFPPLARGESKNCRCTQRRHRFVVGQRIGMLVVKAITQTPNHGILIETQCDCGGQKSYKAHILSRVESCGCRKRRAGSANPLWKGHGQISKSRWCRIQSDAASRKIQFDLSIQQAWDIYVGQDAKCALSGVAIGFGLPPTASLDRIDSSKGYHSGNVQWVHKKINMMKNVLPVDDFVMWCHLVARQMHDNIPDAI